jgi:hypothetical protein
MANLPIYLYLFGYRLLAIGCWLLAVGYWLFVRAAVLAVGLPEPVLELARAALLALVLFAPVLALPVAFSQ